MAEFDVQLPRQSARETATTIDESLEAGTHVQLMQMLLGDVVEPNIFHSYGFARAVSSSLKDMDASRQGKCTDCDQTCVGVDIESEVVPPAENRSEFVRIKCLCPSSGKMLCISNLIVEKAGE